MILKPAPVTFHSLPPRAETRRVCLHVLTLRRASRPTGTWEKTLVGTSCRPTGSLQRQPPTRTLHGRLLACFSPLRWHRPQGTRPLRGIAARRPPATSARMCPRTPQRALRPAPFAHKRPLLPTSAPSGARSVQSYARPFPRGAHGKPTPRFVYSAHPSSVMPSSRPALETATGGE
jgi:hypothetical protein